MEMQDALRTSGEGERHVRFVERRHIGYGRLDSRDGRSSNRNQNPCCAIVVGVMLFLFSFPFLVWNESRSVDVATFLGNARDEFKPVGDGATLNPENDGKLIHFQSDLKFAQLTDDALGLNVTTALLDRDVEMFQWEEERESEDVTDSRTGETTREERVSYVSRWSSRKLNSKQYRDPSYANPTQWPLDTTTFRTRPTKAGAFTFGSRLQGLLIANDAVDIGDNDQFWDVCKPPKSMAGPGGCIQRNGYVYFHVERARIGDIRVSYRYIARPLVSIMGQQRGEMIDPYVLGDRELLLLSQSAMSGDELLDREISANTTTTWVLRLVGSCMMFAGLWVAASSILNIVSKLPILGPLLANLLAIGTCLSIGLLTICLSLVTIAAGWIWARPVAATCVIGIALTPLFISSRRFGNVTAAAKRDDDQGV